STALAPPKKGDHSDERGELLLSLGQRDLELEPTGFDRVQIGVDGIGEDVRPGESPGRVEALSYQEPAEVPPGHQHLKLVPRRASAEVAQPVSFNTPSSPATLSRKPVDSTGS